MAKLAIKKASTDVTTYVFIQDSSKTTGVGLAGLAYNTSSLVGYYVRPKGSATAITLATQTVTGDHSDGGFVEIDATNMPGVYRLDLPDAVCATGVPSVVVMLKGATNMSPVVLEIQLTDFDLNTAAITVDGIADAVWDEAISGHTTGTTFGGKNQKVVPSETINDYKADVSALTNITLASSQPAITWGQQKIIANVSDEGALDIRNTNEHGAGQMNIGGSVGVANRGDIAVVNYGATYGMHNVGNTAGMHNLSSSTGGSGMKNEALGASSSGMHNVGNTAGMHNLSSSTGGSGMKNEALGASSSGMRNEAQGSSSIGIRNIGTARNVAGYDPAQATEATLTAIQADLDNPAQYKADVSGLATSAEVGAITMLDEVVVGSYTMQDILKILAAKMVGKATGGGTTTITYRGLDDNSNVIVETVDSNGNRSAVTLTV